MRPQFIVRSEVAWDAMEPDKQASHWLGTTVNMVPRRSGEWGCLGKRVFGHGDEKKTLNPRDRKWVPLTSGTEVKAICRGFPQTGATCRAVHL